MINICCIQFDNDSFLDAQTGCIVSLIRMTKCKMLLADIRQRIRMRNSKESTNVLLGQ